MKIIKENWKFPEDGWIKYNIDGASRGNSDIYSYAFCLRGGHSDLMYSQGAKLEDSSNIEAEAYVILQEAINCGHT